MRRLLLLRVSRFSRDTGIVRNVFGDKMSYSIGLSCTVKPSSRVVYTFEYSDVRSISSGFFVPNLVHIRNNGGIQENDA